MLVNESVVPPFLAVMVGGLGDTILTLWRSVNPVVNLFGSLCILVLEELYYLPSLN